MPENALYKLEPIIDNPEYEGFAFTQSESLRGTRCLTRDFMPDDCLTKGRAWTVTPLIPYWTPQQVIGRVRSFNDFPCVSLTIPAFSRRAVDALRDYLVPNGELLPLVSAVGEYFVYNTTKVADILDEASSQIQWLSENHTFGQIFEIHRYECFAERMAGLSIFRLVEMPSSTFVNQMFVDRVQQHDLQGFHFIKLWPLPESVSWQVFDKKERKKKVQVKMKRGDMTVRANTVVVMLPTAQAKPSKSEKERLAKIMDDIDTLLHDPSVKQGSPYLGSLEGEDVVEGELRLFLSCPNATALIEKLRPWLKTLTWPGDVKVLKRYGVLTEPNCTEEYVEL